MKPYIILTLFSLLFLVNSLRSRRNKNKSTLNLVARGTIEDVLINGNKITVSLPQNNGETILQTQLILFPGDIISIKAKAGYGQKGGISGYLEYVDEFNKITKIITNKEKWICEQTYPGEEKKLDSSPEVWIWGPKYEANTECKVQIPCLEEKPQSPSTNQNVLAPETPGTPTPTVNEKEKESIVKPTPVPGPQPQNISPKNPSNPGNNQPSQTLEEKITSTSEEKKKPTLLDQITDKPEQKDLSKKEEKKNISNPIQYPAKKRKKEKTDTLSQKDKKYSEVPPNVGLELLNDKIQDASFRRMHKNWKCVKTPNGILAFENQDVTLQCLSSEVKQCYIFKSMNECNKKISNTKLSFMMVPCSSDETVNCIDISQKLSGIQQPMETLISKIES